MAQPVYAYRSLGARAAGIAWQWRAIRALETCGSVRGAGLSANPQLPRPARQAIGRYIHFAIVGRASVFGYL